MRWHLTHPKATPEMLGYLPYLVTDALDTPAREQLEITYAHGGGVRPNTTMTLHDWSEPGKATLTYPNDPPMEEIARAQRRDETLIFFDCSWLAIVQANGDYLITRMD